MSTLSLTLFAALATNLPAQVWSVSSEPGPGVQFTSLQAAIDAAADGDVLLVTGVPLTPQPILIDGKGLTITSGNFLSAANWYSLLEVKNLAADQRLVLRGVSGESATRALYLHDNAGPILLEDVRFGIFAQGIPQPQPLPANVLIENCASVRLERCVGYGYSPVNNQPALPSLQVVASNVVLSHSQFSGGRGQSLEPFATGTATPGAPAAVLNSGSILIQGCQFQGGIGGGQGIPPFFPCTQSAAGGSGLILGTGQPQVTWQASTSSAGANGCSQPPSSLDVWQQSGTLTNWGGIPPQSYFDSPTFETLSLQQHHRGNPGEFVFVSLGQQAPLALSSQFSGAVTVPFSVNFLFSGQITSPTGVLDSLLITPNITPTVIDLCTQGWFVAADFSVRLSSASSLTLFDFALLP